MASVASRDLRNHTSVVLRRVGQGEDITITVSGEPVAKLVPVVRPRPRYLSRDELIDLLENHQADPGLRADLKRLAGETTDDLGPIR